MSGVLASTGPMTHPYDVLLAHEARTDQQRVDEGYRNLLHAILHPPVDETGAITDIEDDDTFVLSIN